MEKPRWRLRSSTYVVDSPHMRLRVDEVELPNGTIVPNYYVRESLGFVTMLAVTDDDRAVMVRQYRYGTDSIHLELPAGTVDENENPDDCMLRELAEETGYEVASWERIGEYRAEPVRSTSRAYVYVGLGARRTGEPRREPTEHMEVELLALEDLRRALGDGTIDSGHSIAAGYIALDHLGKL